ncbi:hypothetical protein SteCoe_25824 [Stentor coeruleus]|uniref:RING-type domain-containing protein n=1 Tax=Stentor coeruleus TaxID=5963 RepID=A0A1R2BED0_9CILI|nr:hypothetical protein SteCoe_25824 [Stentor coeruleus]
MLVIFYLLTGVFSTLKIHSPDELSDLSFNVGYASFGSPGLYSIYGKIVSASHRNCAPSTTYEDHEIPLILYYSDCSFSDLAYKFYISGVKLLLLLSLEDNINFVMLPSYNFEVDNMNIVILMIPRFVYTFYFAYYKNIWISYTYDYIQTEVPEAQLVISGYHENDKKYIESYVSLYKTLKLSISNSSFTFQYSNYSEFMSLTEDCIFFESNYYCLKNTNNSTGSEILTNSILSQSFYNEISQSNKPQKLFIDYLDDLTNICFQNYTLLCSYNLAIKYGFSGNINYEVLKKAELNTLSTGFYRINNLNFYWPGLPLQEIYCLSSKVPNENCPILCNANCKYSDLTDNVCSIYCNSSSCGYSQLKCLEIYKECYSFMMSDGNCNEKCLNDEDCISSHESKSNKYIVLISLTISLPILSMLICIIVYKIRTNNRRNRRVTESESETMIILEPEKFYKGTEVLGDLYCVIDLVVINEGDYVVITPCKHIYHPNCLSQWLSNSQNSEKLCPNCKNSLKLFKIQE